MNFMHNQKNKTLYTSFLTRLSSNQAPQRKIHTENKSQKPNGNKEPKMKNQDTSPLKFDTNHTQQTPINPNNDLLHEDLMQVSIDDYQQPSIIKIGLVNSNDNETQEQQQNKQRQLSPHFKASEESFSNIQNQKKKQYKSRHSEKALEHLEKQSKKVKLRNLIVQKAQKINKNLLPSLLINNPCFEMQYQESTYSPEQRYINYQRCFRLKKSLEEQQLEEARDELQHISRTNSIKKFIQHGNAVFMNKSYQTIDKYDDSQNNDGISSPTRKSIQIGNASYRNNQTFSAENIHQNQRELWEFVHNEPEPNYKKIISDITNKVGNRYRQSQNSNLFSSQDKLYEIRNLYQSRDHNNTIYEDLPSANDLGLNIKYKSHQPYDSLDKKSTNSQTQSLNYMQMIQKYINVSYRMRNNNSLQTTSNFKANLNVKHPHFIRTILEPIHQIQETKQKTEQKLQKLSNKLIERSQQRRFYALLMSQQGKQEQQLFRNPVLNQAYQSQPLNQSYDQPPLKSQKLKDNSTVWNALIETHRS
ncbi:UNKNOWN [Stylonychia lemnae]|uniref:Uncharacterized protein n=1 Tax=Stylonychia lemnae TaxID=5949 RepID=A0A078A9E1_STYLE|nr:UNKNOWN [Stylonychia lemnae]|eukprot:CDW78839.1 UNKNOWN [Stylonychia lemnae]